MARAAQNRLRWCGVVDGLCSIGSDGHKGGWGVGGPRKMKVRKKTEMIRWKSLVNDHRLND